MLAISITECPSRQSGNAGFRLKDSSIIKQFIYVVFLFKLASDAVIRADDACLLWCLLASWLIIHLRKAAIYIMEIRYLFIELQCERVKSESFDWLNSI